MPTRALLLIVLALAAAPAALADGGPMYTQDGGLGVAAPNGDYHYVAVPTNAGDTMLVTVGKDGSVWSWPSFVGSYGIPMVTYRDPGGLSRDGKLLILQSTGYGGPTSFIVVNTRTMRAQASFRFKGWFAFDALSPDGKRLYLTQHVSVNNGSRYVVRAFDLEMQRLLPGRIADRTQRSWVMQGDAMTRTVSPDGRWVYTLYANSGGYPFIHALDTVRGVAHCIGIPWKSVDQTAMGNVALTLHGPRLAVHWRTGKSWLNVDTRTWRVSAAAAGGFPWGRFAAGGALLLLALLGMERIRRLRRSSGVGFSVEGGTDAPPARSWSRSPDRPRVRARRVRRLSRPLRDPRWARRPLERRHAPLRGGEGRSRHDAECDPAQ
jgi:hypothetical protein